MEDCLLDCGKTFFRAGNLDEKIGSGSPLVESRSGRQSLGRIVGQQGRDFERDPAVDGIGQLVDWEKEIGGLSEIFDCQLKEEVFDRLAFLQSLMNGVVVIVTILDGMIEDRGVTT